MKKGLEVEGAAGDDVFLQYFCFTSLFQNCYFLKIIPSEIPVLPNHSSWKNSSKPAFTLDFPCIFLILSTAFNIFLFSLSRNPNVSFLCSQFVHFSSLRHPESLFHSIYFAFLFSCFLYFFLSVVVYDEFYPHPTPPHLSVYHSKVFPLNSFFFSSPAFLLSSIYHLETPSLLLSCFIQKNPFLTNKFYSFFFPFYFVFFWYFQKRKMKLPWLFIARNTNGKLFSGDFECCCPSNAILNTRQASHPNGQPHTRYHR